MPPCSNEVLGVMCLNILAVSHALWSTVKVKCTWLAWQVSTISATFTQNCFELSIYVGCDKYPRELAARGVGE